MSIYIPTNSGDYVTQSQLSAYATTNALNNGLSSKISATGTASFSAGTITSTGLLTSNANLVVTGTSAISSNETVGGTLTVTGKLTTNSTNIALGNAAATTNQGSSAVAIGNNSGNANQGINAISIGNTCGAVSQATNSVAIGTQAAQSNQLSQSVAIGYQAAMTSQGANSVCIGGQAGKNSCPANTIVINSTSSELSPSTAGVYVSSIRSTLGTSGLLMYDSSTKEITYSSGPSFAGFTCSGNCICNGDLYANKLLFMSGANTELRVSGVTKSTAAWGTTGPLINIANNSTYNDTSTAASGTATSEVICSFKTPTLTATNTGVTTTTASNMYVEDVTAGTRQTISNNYAIWNNGGLRVDKQLVMSVTSVTGTSYTQLASDYCLLCSNAAAVAITLKACPSGAVLKVKDTLGAGRVGNDITITPASGNIDGAATTVISTAYGSVNLTSDGTNWFIC